MPKIIFILHQIGHYHKARFEALGKECELHVIEIQSNSKEYEWKKEDASPFYKKYESSDISFIKYLINEKIQLIDIQSVAKTSSQYSNHSKIQFNYSKKSVL